ncbi:YqjF family protein [Halopelagius fulvigenes]|uniref:YqjF family protein n=1 Tax=Halopelagius fulvigenes TaxID=1198324 RepID=A0ABD5U0Q9_9EURY
MIPIAFGWEHVLFANWRVDADVIDAHIPDALSVQEFDGSGWLSIVPFRNVDVRPRGLPASVGIPVPELNLRTYVTCDGEQGVYFFNLDASSLLATVGARLTHHLPYYYSRIRMGGEDGRVRFENRRCHPGDRPVTFFATYGPTGDAFKAEPGSLTEFLTERRRLYTQDMSGQIRYTDISHERWPLYDAEWTVEENTLFEANGFDHPDGDPILYYSPRTDVVTTRSKRWRS